MEPPLFHVTAFGDKVSMTAMSAGDVVLAFERPANAGRHGLLPHVEVNESGDTPSREQLRNPFLKHSNF